MPAPVASRSLSADTTAHPLAPAYILRAHAAPVSSLLFSQDGRFLYSGDTDGYVAMWRLRTFRPRYLWKAHEGGILGLAELDGGLLTQGRDNFVHLYHFPLSGKGAEAKAGSSIDIGAATAVPSPSHPSPGFGEPGWTLDVNAMNFCRMSVLPLRPTKCVVVDRKGKGRADPDCDLEEAEQDTHTGGGALIAVPSLTKDDCVDVFHYPSKARIHRSISKDAFIGHKTGSVMAVHLFYPPRAGSSPTNPTSATANTASTDSAAAPDLHILIGYESGHLALFRFHPNPSFELVTTADSQTYHRPRSGKMVEENEGWELVWAEKGHRDAVMSLAVDSKARFAYTVAADHFLCKYRISDLSTEEAALPRIHVEPTPSPGKSGVAVRGDGKLLATAGWNGELRLYSAKTLAPLAVLSLHRLSLQAIAFAPVPPSRIHPTTAAAAHGVSSDPGTGSDTDDDEDGGGGASTSNRRRLWLATGGQETKISLWEPYPARPL
ncbi:hypothetical protein JCM8115_002503 [Rhodotorula mucilaginosa]